MIGSVLYFKFTLYSQWLMVTTWIWGGYLTVQPRVGSVLNMNYYTKEPSHLFNTSVWLEMTSHNTERTAMFRITIPNILSSLGTSQFSFNTETLGSTWFGAEVVSQWDQNSIEMRKIQIIPENCSPKALYWEVGTRSEVPEPVHWNRGIEASVPKPGLNCKIGTVPTLFDIRQIRSKVNIFCQHYIRVIL